MSKHLSYDVVQSFSDFASLTRSNCSFYVSSDWLQRDNGARNVIERLFCRLKDWRRIATRYDRLAANFASAVAPVAALTCWID